jgi:hypothetical protein
MNTKFAAVEDAGDRRGWTVPANVRGRGRDRLRGSRARGRGRGRVMVSSDSDGDEGLDLAREPEDAMRTRRQALEHAVYAVSSAAALLLPPPLQLLPHPTAL